MMKVIWHHASSEFSPASNRIAPLSKTLSPWARDIGQLLKKFKIYLELSSIMGVILDQYFFNYHKQFIERMKTDFPKNSNATLNGNFPASQGIE
jgi:hypothetical protein